MWIIIYKIFSNLKKEQSGKKYEYEKNLILFILFFFIFKGDILYAQDNTKALTNREACQLYYSNVAASKDKER